MKCVECGTEEGGTWGSSEKGWLCSGCCMIQRGIRIAMLEAALREFTQRVERGEIKSERTYKKFKELLGETTT